MRQLIARCLLAAVAVSLTAAISVQAQDAYSTNADGSIYTYSTNADGSANIVAYAGPPWVVAIPTNINGLAVTSIGESAFQGTSLINVAIPGSVTNIGAYAYGGCTNLTNAAISNGVTIIGAYAFFDCINLTSITIPGSVASIGEEAFYDCTNLTNATIAFGVTSIGEDAFLSCTGLTSVTLPDSITSIGDSAFRGDALAGVTIHGSVTNIGAYAFVENYSLTAIMVDANNPSYSSANGVLFDKSQTTLIEYPGGLGGSYTIPNGVTSIGTNAFFYCYLLTNVTIPGSVTTVGEEAFVGCANLANLTIPDSVTSIGGLAFDGDGLTSVTIPGSVTNMVDAFAGCTSLTNATIDNGVTSIGKSEFNGCTSLTSVTIPGSVTNIGRIAFYDCANLTGVYFTGDAPAGGLNAFLSDNEATAYYLPGTAGWSTGFDGLPTAPWFLPNPVILNNSASFGAQPGGFGFTISWATNASVVVEAATNLANPVWIPVSTNTLTGGTNYFSDPQWTNYPSRFYRAVGTFTVGGTLTGLPDGDTVTLQNNGADNLTLSNNGTFTFPTVLPDGRAYSVTFSGVSGATSLLTEIYQPVVANGSGTISDANVTNVAFQFTPIYTGYLDRDLYNAAVADGTANGGVPGVMFTEQGGPFKVTAAGGSHSYSHYVAEIYLLDCVFTHVVGTYSCSSTTLTNGAEVIQWGTVLECGFGPYGTKEFLTVPTKSFQFDSPFWLRFLVLIGERLNCHERTA